MLVELDGGLVVPCLAAPVAAFAADLLATLTRLPCEPGEQLAQEALDLVAAAAGLKALAVLVDEARETDDHVFGAALAAGPLVAHAGPAWTVVGELDGLPDWYAAAVRAHRRRRRLVFAGPAGAAARAEAFCAGADVWPILESESLGYPPCCVDAQHARTRAFHRQMARTIERAGHADRARMRRLAETAVVLKPTDREERQALAATLATMPAPFTSINMCPACAGDAASPAQRLSRAYAELARRSGLARLFPAAASA